MPGGNTCHEEKLVRGYDVTQVYCFRSGDQGRSHEKMTFDQSPLGSKELNYFSI